MLNSISKYIVNLFNGDIKVVFMHTETMVFIRGGKIPFIFNWEDNDVKGSITKLLEKLSEVKVKYLKGCLALPVLWFNISDFTGDKLAFKSELAVQVKNFGCGSAFLLEGSKKSTLFDKGLPFLENTDDLH